MPKEKPYKKINVNTVEYDKRIPETGLDEKKPNPKKIAESLKLILGLTPEDFKKDKSLKVLKSEEKPNGLQHVVITYPYTAGDLISQLEDMLKSSDLGEKIKHGTKRIKKEGGFGDITVGSYNTLAFDVGQAQRIDTRIVLAKFINKVAQQENLLGAVSAIESGSRGIE